MSARELRPDVPPRSRLRAGAPSGQPGPRAACPEPSHLENAPGQSPFLTEAEKLEVCALVLAGLPLPEDYRERLFDGHGGEKPASAGPEKPVPAGSGKPAPAIVHRELLLPSAGANPARNPVDTLVRGDNADVLRAIQYGPLAEAVAKAGGVKLIYLDPPFAVGADFPIPLEIGAGGIPAPPVSATAFTDSWGEGPRSYAAMLFERLRLMREVLAEDGSIYMHCDRRAAPTARLFMDYLFGPERFLGEIIWHYTGGGRSTRYFSRKHDIILHYAKSARWTFNVDAVRVPYKETSGYARSGIVSAAGKHYAPHPGGTPVDDVWSIPIVNPMSGERLAYPTQKPEALLERIILASSNPGDLVADFFCGSGTTLAVARRLGRRWIGADAGAFAVHTARKRLLRQAAEQTDVPSAPFAVVDCVSEGADLPAAPCAVAGRVSKRAGAEEEAGNPAEAALQYPVPQNVISLPGRVLELGKPEIRACLLRVGGGFLVELQGFFVADAAAVPGHGKDFEGPLPGSGRRRARKGPAQDEREDRQTLCVRNGLLCFASPDLPLMNGWADWIDYWSLDPDFAPGAFAGRWQSFRTRRDKRLSLQSPVFALPEGPFRAALLVVDIFNREHMLELHTDM